MPVVSNQRSNKFVKEVFQFAGLDRKCRISKFMGGQRIDEDFELYKIVATHTARRTFITLSLEKGMPQDAIREITGHRDHRSMQVYVKFSEKVVEDVMEMVWNTR